MIPQKELDNCTRMIAQCIEASKEIQFTTQDGRAIYSNLLVQFGILSQVLANAKMYAENGFLNVEVFNAISEEFVKLGTLMQEKITQFIGEVPV